MMVLTQPSTAGLCNSDTMVMTTPTGNGAALPTLCGTNTGQHSKTKAMKLGCILMWLYYKFNNV